ncbi:3-deoxy-7-phosphoheptulonate synthase [Dactylosporangium sp. NPDC051541]|uniref:3-deoxy-7-phosphoheptulonate synthase n=1 Tax=Dactylosporangium sp. NPDC051541 TaxID=3363977 RepID=UPI0037A3FBEF
MDHVIPAPAAAVRAAPQWPSDEALAKVAAELATRPPLVRPDDCQALRRRLAQVARGEAMVVQAGDCAELFAEATPERTRHKVAQLGDLTEVLRSATGLPAVPIGRIAGQFAKPRSNAVEVTASGARLPVYRGDAVNAFEPTHAARAADPSRMLTAYDRSADVLRSLDAGHAAGAPKVYASHEALLLEYEAALIREDLADGVTYGSSGHLLWIGDRTRQVSGPYVGLVAAVANPVAVKLGPDVGPDDVAALVERLDPDRVEGRLTLIARLGVGNVEERLPVLVRAVRATGARPVWLSDPMHGNTIPHAGRGKTRAVSDVIAETRAFARILLAHGAHPGGLHLEATPDDVTECVPFRHDAAAGVALPRWRSACDPRLNPHQTLLVIHAFTAALAGR